MFPRVVELADGGPALRLDQQEEGDVGGVVWDAALVLGRYLERREEGLRGRRAVELGAGTGAVGIVAAALGARVLLTDLPLFVPLLEHNISVNKEHLGGRASSAQLTWGEESQVKEALQFGPFDFILVADCVYYAESVGPLVETLTQLAEPHTRLLVSYEDRDSPAKLAVLATFLRLMDDKFSRREVPLDEQHPDYRSEALASRHTLEISIKKFF